MAKRTFLGFDGLEDLTVHTQDIVNAEEAGRLCLSPFKHVRDFLDLAKEAKFKPLPKADFSITELDIYNILQDHSLLDGSLFDKQMAEDLPRHYKEQLLMSLSQILELAPSLKIIDFLNLLVDRYATNPYASPVVDNILQYYDYFAQEFFLKTTPALCACLTGMLDTCLIYGSQNSFQYYYFQASTITKAWVTAMHPVLQFRKIRGIDQCRVSSVLFNLWSNHLDHCLNFMSHDVCYNMWLSLMDVLPCNDAPKINSAFVEALAFLQKNIILSRDDSALEHTFTDDLGTNIRFGDSTCAVNGIVSYWSDIKDLIYQGSTTFINFSNNHSIELMVRDLNTSEELRKHLNDLAYKGLYRRWHACLQHNMPIYFGCFIIRNKTIEFKHYAYNLHQVQIRILSTRQTNYLSFFDTKSNREITRINMSNYPNACMLLPLKKAIQNYQQFNLSSLCLAWEKLTPEYNINLDIPDNNSFESNFILNALKLAKEKKTSKKRKHK